MLRPCQGPGITEGRIAANGDDLSMISFVFLPDDLLDQCCTSSSSTRRACTTRNWGWRCFAVEKAEEQIDCARGKRSKEL